MPSSNNTRLSKHYFPTVVNLYVQRKRAREDQFIAAPTLVRQSLLPPGLISSDLSETGRLLAELDSPLKPLP